MQILIELKGKDEGIHHANEETKQNWEHDKLHELLLKLEEDGYRIKYLYSENKFNELIDYCIPKENATEGIKIVDSIFANDAKLAIIRTDEKDIGFFNKYFIAMCFFK